MIDKKNQLVFISHILENINDIESFSKGISKEKFLGNKEKQKAIVHSIETIGEATRNLPLDFTSNYPHIEWAKIIGMRNKLIHNYFGVDWEIVWDGNGIITCEALTKYPDFPSDLIPQCYDQTKNTMVIR